MDDKQGALIEAPNNITPGSQLCSPGLSKLLDDASGGGFRIVAMNPTLKAEAERLLPVLEQAKDPADEREILSILIRQAPAYGVKPGAGEEWGALFAAYLDALEGLPGYAVEEAFVRWNRGEGDKKAAEWGIYPKPSQLSLLAQAAKTALWTQAYRVRRAVEYVEAHPVVWTPQRKREERDKAIAMGFLTPDGKAVPLPPVKGIPPGPARPRMSQHEMAEQLRRHADTPRDVGEVI